MDRALLLHNTSARGMASLGAAWAQLLSPEGKHEHIPEEKRGLAPLSCSGVQGITCLRWHGQSRHSRPKAKRPPQHHHSEPAKCWGAGASSRRLPPPSGGTGETLRSEQLPAPARKPSHGSRGGGCGGSGQEQLRAGAAEGRSSQGQKQPRAEAAEGRSRGKDASRPAPLSGLSLQPKDQHQQPGSKTQ